MTTRGWIKTLIIGGIGGGIAGMFQAALNPAEYKFPKDFGSGKLWPYFFQGAGLTIGALCLRSPFGEKLLGQWKQTQAQLNADKATIAQTKAELKGGADQETKN